MSNFNKSIDTGTPRQHLMAGQFHSSYPKAKAMSDKAVKWLVENKGVRYVNYDTGEGLSSLPVSPVSRVSDGQQSKSNSRKRSTGYNGIIERQLFDGRVHSVKDLLNSKTRVSLTNAINSLRHKGLDIRSEFEGHCIVGFQLVRNGADVPKSKVNARVEELAKQTTYTKQTYIEWLKQTLSDSEQHTTEYLLNGRGKQFFYKCLVKLKRSGMVVKSISDGRFVVAYQCVRVK